MRWKAFLKKKKIKLDFILNTHHHLDHIGGNLKLKQKYNCKIVGNKHDSDRIPGIDIFLEEGDTFSLGNSKCSVIEVSGHTNGHISYFFKEDLALFCGDTLFSLGCGRLFEGTPSQMVNSLNKIRSLPDETKVYCAHEYTKAKNIPTVPSLLKEEKRLNPFLKFDDPGFIKSIGMEFNSSEENFGKIRRLKDVF